jgi:AraC-like DNA-binding protein
VVTRVIDHLNRNLTDELSLDALSQQFFVSKYYLCHAFRRQTGVSIFAYVNTKRIAMAQQLLANGEPATSVAYAVGYGTYSSFYRAFCKQTGHPPAHKR